MSAIGSDEAEVQPTSTDTDDIFIRLKKIVTEGYRARSNFYTQSKRAYKFVANHQWDEDDLATLNAQNRPAVAFNRSAPIIKAVCGLEVNNRQSVIYLPRKEGDVVPDEIRSQAARWMRDGCNAEDEESSAFRDLTIAGEGWTETRMDYETNYRGKYMQQRVHPSEMGTNKGACRPNYDDARLLFRVKELDSDEAEQMFPGFDAEAIHARWFDDAIMPADGGQGNKIDYPSKTRESINRETGRRTKVRVVHVQWWEREPLHLVAVEGEEKLQELSSADFEKFEQRAKALMDLDRTAMDTFANQVTDYSNIALADPTYALTTPPPEPPAPQAPVYRSEKVMVRCYYEAFLGGYGMVGERQKLKMNEFTFKCMTGEWDDEDKCFYGMLRDMFDPQMWANKWLSQTMHIMNTNAKGGIMAETDAFVNVRKAEREWADNTKIIWVKPGSLEKNKIKERQAPPLPQGLGELMQFAIGSLRDVTGVNLELLGQADREQAAILETQRRQAAMTILATLFDSLRRYRKGQGGLTLKFIQFLPTGTLIRVTNSGQHKFIPLVQQGSTDDFDVIIDETPTSPDQKQAVWGITMQLMQSGIPMPPPVLISLLKYSPYPASVVEEIREASGLGSKMPPELLQQKLQQAEQALQMMEGKLQEAMEKTKELESDKTVESMKLLIEDYRAETERLSAEWKNGIDTMKAIADAMAQPNPTDGASAQQPQV